tara:strand:+ start:681 stop:983 length:303 start_codon:yes stop_codon:yes gene_type:complete
MNKSQIKRINKYNLDFYENRIPTNLKEIFFIPKPKQIEYSGIESKEPQVDYALQYTSEPRASNTKSELKLSTFLFWTVLMPFALFLIICGIFGGTRRWKI